MIKILGARRIIILVVLAAINIILASVLYLYLMPEKTQKEREERTSRSKISGLRGDINRLQIEFEQLEIQRTQFEILKKRGFFTDQGRRQAVRNLELNPKRGRRYICAGKYWTSIIRKRS